MDSIELNCGGAWRYLDCGARVWITAISRDRGMERISSSASVVIERIGGIGNGGWRGIGVRDFERGGSGCSVKMAGGRRLENRRHL